MQPPQTHDDDNDDNNDDDGDADGDPREKEFSVPEYSPSIVCAECPEWLV